MDPISAFCEAIRGKKDWYHKILDPTRNLGLKWATEAGLVGPNLSRIAEQDDGPDITAVLQELKNEAKRIVFFDYDIRMDDTVFKEPNSNVDVESFDADILSSLRYAAGSAYGVRAPVNLSEEVGVFISDDLVPASLHRELVFHLDALAQREPPDLHPGSYGKVQDLIHPSLYPFVLGESLLNDASKSSALPSSAFEAHFEIAAVSTDLSSRYAWLPTVFNVSDDGKDVRIQSESYISGLGPREHFPRLYRLIEKIFLLALPHFKRTLDFQYEYEESPSVERWRERLPLRWVGETQSRIPITRSEWEKVLDTQRAEKNLQTAKLDEITQAVPKATDVDPTDRTQFALDNTADAFSFQGRQLKVIVKAANYQLKTGQTYKGTWHMEGMPHERIVASVIYYYDTDPTIVDEGLKFRKGREPGFDFPTDEEFQHEAFTISFRPEADGNSEDEDDEGDDEDAELDSASDYPSDWEDNMRTSALPGYIELGCVPTTNFTSKESETSGTGRMLSFPNWIQHQVGKLSVAETNPKGHVAKRKILCFFLVEDGEAPENRTSHGIIMFEEHSNEVLTTADVPSQVRMTNIRTLRFLLPFICQRITGKNLPAELVQLILDRENWGFSREEAERHRQSLMKDRVVDADAVVGDSYTLCEH
ncbi:hypothetical protein B0H19DRAFT_1246959 [Mycena capillaripes]|nr:hypothetical protein B0H19DRAFT_1246959 [Mycena capillaripes]